MSATPRKITNLPALRTYIKQVDAGTLPRKEAYEHAGDALDEALAEVRRRAAHASEGVRKTVHALSSCRPPSLAEGSK
jgi:hypothetical protein